jgi:hypothetical protein
VASALTTGIPELSLLESALCAGYVKPNRGPQLQTITIVMVSVAVPVVLLRLFSRWYISKTIGADDAVIFLAAVSCNHYQFPT